LRLNTADHAPTAALGTNLNARVYTDLASVVAGKRRGSGYAALSLLQKRGCLVHPPPIVKAAPRRSAGPAATLTTGPLRVT